MKTQKGLSSGWITTNLKHRTLRRSVILRRGPLAGIYFTVQHKRIKTLEK
jgi:hypothetical protein